VLESFIVAVQNMQEVNEYCLPDIELNFVHKVHNHHTEYGKAENRQFIRKCILDASAEIITDDSEQVGTYG
jgi:hypothetical protein